MTLAVTLVDCGSSKVPDLRAMIEAAGSRVFTVSLAHARTAPAADAVVISGGPRLFTAEPALVEELAFIDALDVPALGICLGHQAIALRHGAEVYLGAARRGPETIRIAMGHPLLMGLGPEPVFTQDHCEGVTLPDGFVCLASSEHYPVEILACDRLRLYGVQFHPEISGEAGLTVLANFVSLARAR